MWYFFSWHWLWLIRSFFLKICFSYDPQHSIQRFKKKGRTSQSEIKEILRATGNKRDLMVLTKNSVKVNKRCISSLFNFTKNKLTWEHKWKQFMRKLETILTFFSFFHFDSIKKPLNSLNVKEFWLKNIFLNFIARVILHCCHGTSRSGRKDVFSKKRCS